MRHSLRLAAAAAAAMVICAGVVSGAAGCAGELPNKDVVVTSPTTAPGPTTSIVESQADELGRQVAATWSEVMQKLVPIIDGNPPYPSVETRLLQLKEEYIQKLVPLGRQIAALDVEQQGEAYDRSQDVLAGMASADWFVKYMDIYNTYSLDETQAGQDFAILLAGFDTLTDYAFFDILLANYPEEAARLGVE